MILNITGTKTFLFLMFLFGLFPILPFNMKPLPLIIGLVFGGFYLVKEKKIIYSKYFFYNSLIFIFYLISILYSDDKVYAFTRIQTSLSLILFPLFFLAITNMEISKKGILKMEKIFFFTFYLASLLLCFTIAAYIYHLGYFSNLVSYDYCMAYIRDQMWFGLYEHPIYISLLLSFSILFSFRLLSRTSSKYCKALFILANIILFGFLVFFSRKGVLIGFLVSISYLLLKTFSVSKIKLSAVVIVVFVTSFLLLPKSLERVEEVFNLETYYNPIDEKNSTSIRIAVYKCAVINIAKTGFFGYGIGDVKNILNDCYKPTSSILLKTNLNTHNQFLNSLLVNGFFGLFILFFVFYQNIFFSINNKDYLFTSILILYFIVMLTENILDRQNGVILFSLLVNYFIFKNNLNLKLILYDKVSMS